VGRRGPHPNDRSTARGCGGGFDGGDDVLELQKANEGGVRWGPEETDEGGHGGAHLGRGGAAAAASILGGVVTTPTTGVDRRQEW
jgi:hypothetical protein